MVGTVVCQATQPAVLPLNLANPSKLKSGEDFVCIIIFRYNNYNLSAKLQLIDVRF